MSSVNRDLKKLFFLIWKKFEKIWKKFEKKYWKKWISTLNPDHWAYFRGWELFRCFVLRSKPHHSPDFERGPHFHSESYHLVDEGVEGTMAVHQYTLDNVNWQSYYFWKRFHCKYHWKKMEYNILILLYENTWIIDVILLYYLIAFSWIRGRYR